MEGAKNELRKARLLEMPCTNTFGIEYQRV
jgi:hypothetical protein